MTFAFSLIAFLLLGAAVAAMLSRNLIHSALLLIGAWAGIAAFYLWAGAEFVAFAQVLVYVGAVSMVVLFAVLLTRQGATSAPVEFDSYQRAVAGFITAGGVAGVLLGAILGTPMAVRATPARHVAVLRQLAGFFERALGDDDRAELALAISGYQRRRVPRSVALALIRAHVTRLGVAHLAEQVYLSPSLLS